MRHSASKWPLLWAVGAAILISAPARAQEEPTQPNPTLRFKLDRRDGCFRYIGDACRIHRPLQDRELRRRVHDHHRPAHDQQPRLLDLVRASCRLGQFSLCHHLWPRYPTFLATGQNLRRALT